MEGGGVVKLNDIWRMARQAEEARVILENRPALADDYTLRSLGRARDALDMAWHEIVQRARETGYAEGQGGEWEL
jgi:hypothetical protein